MGAPYIYIYDISRLRVNEGINNAYKISNFVLETYHKCVYVK